VLESAYVRAMHALARPLRASGLLPRLERAPRASWRFWFASQFAIYDAARLVALDVPWWTLAAIERVERWIAARNGRVRVFEYGSGASTAWLARRCEHVTSVEHDAAFARYITPLLAHDNVTLHLVEPRRPVSQPLVGSSRRGYEDCDFSAYVDRIADDRRYDLIVIDGRARVACLERAVRYLAEGGLIVFDNSGRKRYQAALRRRELRVERCCGRTPALPYPSETTLIELQHG
jgi:Methyltransferase domain